MNREVRNRFLNDIGVLIEELPFALFATGIKKEKHLARYGSNALNPYDAALNFCFERVLHFMEQNGESHLPVVAEARGKKEDNELMASFHKLMTKGTEYNDTERFRRLHCPLSFQTKRNNIAGIQLADLCAYPIARNVLKPDEQNRAY